ncbi:NRDE family protein [Vibrio nigripulchritudo]|uniref:NRDE family protein n=1 Tax=Vibrio nigripulchritudo TaxID=28173 RepID=UPI0005FA0E0F|nr:NRDE family protein [Vibrio nigripulchritudo]KJY75639.1 hypothetical protein TW74_16770 [Vibrio nigripulchritudo]
MCTVSWLLTDNGYQVFFNRDEQKSRAQAVPPTPFCQQGVEYLMPVDPDGGGSWIATNEHGQSICLLNYYQGMMPKGELTSRGQLVKSLASFTNYAQVDEYLQSIELSQFAPFSMLIFEPDLTKHNSTVKGVCWTGQSLVYIRPNPPLISSSVDYQMAFELRSECYQSFTAIEANVDQLLAFHSSHIPSKGHLSTCMHRKDAHTVSFTHILVNESEKGMSYYPGSPCTGVSESYLTQNRISLLPTSNVKIA